jgi:hypothetical protein
VPRSQETHFDEVPITGLALTVLVPADLTAALVDLRGGRGMPGWYGSPESTEGLLAQVAPWCSELPEVYLRPDGPQVRVNGADATELTAAALRNQANLVLSGTERKTRLRRACFSHLGQLAVFSLTANGTPQQDASHLRELLRRIAPYVEHGAVRTSRVEWDGWADLVPRSPAPSYGAAAFPALMLRQVRHLLGRRVLDAYGVQVLTDEHLSRAHDLSDWLVESLGGGLHLVLARDLDAWLRPKGPGCRR